jgi:hypothetical protein
MEQSVGWADRVLMICTETYVRKADEGKGGVGYPTSHFLKICQQSRATYDFYLHYKSNLEL